MESDVTTVCQIHVAMEHAWENQINIHVIAKQDTQEQIVQLK